jgi:hypothetical protein
MRRLILLMLLGLGTTAAKADNGLFYVGAGITDTSLTASYGGSVVLSRRAASSPLLTSRDP